MYITVEELDRIVKILAVGGVYERVGYEGLTDEHKELLIEKAVVDIDSQLYVGRKVSSKQANAFPRIINGTNTLIPPSLKYAVASYVIRELKVSNSKRLQLQAEGVTSIDTSGVKESYKEEAVDNSWKGYLRSYLY